MRRLFRGWAWATMAAVVLTGCVKNKAVVRVNAAGGGELRLEHAMPAHILAMIERQIERQRQRLAETGQEGPPANFVREGLFGERTLRYLAPLYGDVEFVEARRIERENWIGVEAVYRFRDIGRVWLPIDEEARGRAVRAVLMSAGGGELPPLPAKKSAHAISFEWTPAERGGKLVVRMPELTMIEMEDDPHWTPPERSEMTEALGRDPDSAAAFGIEPGMTHVQTLKKIYGEMETRVELRVEGTVKSATAQYPVKERPKSYTLFLMDFARILESPRGVRLFSDEENLRGRLPPMAKGVPGIEIESDGAEFEIAP